MMKNIKSNFLILILLVAALFYSLLPYDSVFSFNESDKCSNDEVKIVFQDSDYCNLPNKFRKTTDLQSIANNTNLNLTGLSDLNISGSEQFSKINLPILIKAIDTELPTIVVDLRQESHGFIDGLPMSYENEKNDANKGLNTSQVIRKENKQLSSIKIGEPLTVYSSENSEPKTIIPKEVQSEIDLTKINDLSYLRIAATDEELPSPDIIDYFVENIDDIKDASWLHFHCKEGIGRTTTFMIFYDMMKNYDKVSAKDIVNRQIALVDFTPDDIELITSEKRINLYNDFFNFYKERVNNPKLSFSDYLKTLNKQ